MLTVVLLVVGGRKQGSGHEEMAEVRNSLIFFFQMSRVAWGHACTPMDDIFVAQEFVAEDL